MIGTVSFLQINITSEIGIESQQSWYHSAPWPKRNITVPTVTRSDLMLRFGVPSWNSTFSTFYHMVTQNQKFRHRARLPKSP